MRAVEVALFASALALSDCSDGETRAVSLSERIEQDFPGHAAKIIGGLARPSHTTRGFELGRVSDSARLEAILPERAADSVLLRARGIDIRVREIGAVGSAAIVGSAIAYEADARGRASLWSTTANGCEEWLVVPEGIAGEVAVFEIDGARPVLRDGVVLLLDTVGAPRVVITAPSAEAAGGRPIGVHLGVRGDRVVVSIDAHEGAALVDPAWAPAASMATARMRHTATLLSNGKVLVTGGVGAAGDLASAELYDPAADAWSPAATMAGARSWHDAVLLANGNVLAIGGVKGGISLASVELYEPALDLWVSAAPMLAARFRFSATVLANGDVLAVGGFTASGTTGSAEIYDPSVDKWSPAASLTPRGGHRATLLQDGKVLVTGGLFVSAVVTSTLAEAWLYDPTGDAWSAAASLAAARFDHTATLLGSGRIFVAGGSTSDGFTTSNLASAERYDPTGDAWSPAGTLSAPRAEHVAALLATGGVVVASGDANGATADLYDPGANALAPTTAMTDKRIFATATALPNGKVLVAGGEAVSVLASSELFTPPVAPGVSCALPSDCASGFCVSNVCCAMACTGACSACSVAAGATADGVCSPIGGVACDDGNPCTLGDQCEAGVCTAGAPMACAPIDSCHASGSCDPMTAMCTAGTGLPDKTVCDDANACTSGDSCVSGVCIGATSKTCPPAADQCHQDGVCDAMTGLCVSDPVTDGAICDDMNACTTADTCVGGVCFGTFTMCIELDDCHEPGTCDPATGNCSTPIRADGTTCEGGTCTGGACIGPPTSTTADTGAGGGGGDDGSGGAGGASETETGTGTCGCVVVGGRERESGTLAGIGVMLVLGALRRRKRRQF